MPTKSIAESASDDAADDSGRDDQILIEVFENGTLMGAVVSEPTLQPIGESADNIQMSSVITLTSDMLNFSRFNVDSPSRVVSCANLSSHTNPSMPSGGGDTCSGLVIDASNNLSSISGMLNQVEYLNSSDTCSSTLDSSSRRTSNSKRTSSRRKLKKCRPTEIFVNPFPPPYATIYVDAGRGSGGGGAVGGTGSVGIGPTSHRHQSNGTAAGATTARVPSTTGYQNSLGSFAGGHLTVQLPGIRRSLPEPPTKKCCTDWFTRPSLPFVIGILALGGVACTLGGIVLGSTGLIEHSTQYLSAALLMIGIGVSMLVISGAIWRLSIPDDTESFQCFRPSFDSCRNCNSPYCANRFLTGAYFYPEFQHRQPPPSYMTTLQEYRLLVPEQLNDTSSNGESQRVQSPPPSYRSYSLNTLSASLHDLEQSRNITESEIQTSDKPADGS